MLFCCCYYYFFIVKVKISVMKCEKEKVDEKCFLLLFAVQFDCSIYFFIFSILDITVYLIIYFLVDIQVFPFVWHIYKHSS